MTNPLMRYLLLILLLVFGCSDSYEAIDENTRLNKKTGEVEILQSTGDWVSKSLILKDQAKPRVWCYECNRYVLASSTGHKTEPTDN